MLRRRTFLLSALLLTAANLALAADPADGPPIRIRLSSADDSATVACGAGLRVLDLETGKPIGPDPFGPKAIVVVERSGDRPPTVYRAQVASLTSEEEARSLAADLGKKLGVPFRVYYHADRRAWRVRLGEGKSPQALDDLVKSLTNMGYDQVWVTEDVPESERGALRVVDSGWNDYPAPRPTLRILPARGCDRLEVGEGSYRGVLEARLDRRGRLALLNELPMEQYLRGVVPNELGPGLYPEVEALKAQAVAARTYAWRNLGQFAEDGYDLCDTPRCQVYKGAGTEQELSDKAVAETAGLIAVYDGEPIHALYSSTCGGHTEDGINVFPEEDGPYLRGVPCYPERAGDGRHRWVLHGREPGDALLDGAGRPVGRDRWLLESHGVLDAAGWDRAGVGGAASEAEEQAWIAATLRVVGKADPGGRPGRVRTRNELAVELVSRLRWKERAELLVAPADLEYLLDFPDAGHIPRGDRRTWALLLKDGLLTPFPDGTLRPDASPTRADLVGVLAGLLRHYDAEDLTAGSLRGVVGDTLQLDQGGDEVLVRLRPDTRLVKELRDEKFPVAQAELLAGDKVAYRASRTGEVDFLEVRPSPKSASDDRFITVYEWEERVTTEDLQDRLSKNVRGFGRLVDLEPVQRGESGRILALRVRGTSGSQVIRGFPIRSALGVRETLFAIDRQRDAAGRVTAFVFSGKGWGHGVGLCQVGAYGMALRGADFREILLHYYTGIDLKRAYP